MKKILLRAIFLISFLFVCIIIYLSTIGYQTSQFNNLSLNIKKIKIKLNIRDFTLYLSTKEPNIIFNQVSLPIEELKSFIDLKSLIRKNILITKVSLNINDVDYNDIEKIVRSAYLFEQTLGWNSSGREPPEWSFLEMCGGYTP